MTPKAIVNKASPLAALAVALAAVLAGGCTPPDELDGDDLEQGLQFDELVRSRSTNPDGPAAPPGDLPAWEDEEIVLTPDRLARLPADLKTRPALAQLAVSRAMQSPISYQGGVYGLLGPAKVFAATTDTIKDGSRLYWVMVKVLSEKYGCFMTEKLHRDLTTHIRCRDGRQVMFWQSHGPGWIQFVTRQYDRQGFEIVVRKRQIVRIGTERAI